MRALCIFLSLTLGANLTWSSTYRSPADIAYDIASQSLFIAEKEGQSLAQLSLDSNAIQRMDIPGSPTGISLHEDSLWLTYLNEQSMGFLAKIDFKGQKISNTLELNYGAIHPLYDPESQRIYVLNKFAGTLSVIDANTLRLLSEIAVNRMPVSAALEPSSGHLFIAHLLPDMASDLDEVYATISVMDTDTLEIVERVPLPVGSTAVRDIKMDPQGTHLVVSHGLSRYQLPVNRLDRGWIITHAISIIDLRKQYAVKTLLLDDVNRGAPAPWGIAFSEDGKYLAVALSGSHEVSLIDYEGMIEELDYGHTQLATVAPYRKRLATQGLGPRAVTFAGGSLVAANYYSDTLTAFNITQVDKLGSVTPLTDSIATPSLARKGEIIFHDATYSYQNWASCTTCHVDSRSDGLNWDLLGDGMGNPKNTKSLLYSHQTLPMGYDGSRPQIEGSTFNSFKFILEYEPTKQITDAVDAYIQSLRHISIPEKGAEDEIALGHDLFHGKAECYQCHSGEYFADTQIYEMDNAGPNDHQSAWVTPTLFEMWRSGPYLHDGRANTLNEVFDDPGHREFTHELSPRERQHLVTYLKSI